MFKVEDSGVDLSEQSDDFLVARGLSGEQAALDILFRRHRSAAYKVAHRILADESDSLDAVQNGFINAFTHLQHFRGESSFQTWILRIVNNAALDLARKRQRSHSRYVHDEQILELSTAEGGGGGDQFEEKDLRSNYLKALETLSDNHRKTFLLYVEAELSYREIAERLGLSIGTVMSRIFTVRQKLKVLLAEYAS